MGGFVKGMKIYMMSNYSLKFGVVKYASSGLRVQLSPLLHQRLQFRKKGSLPLNFTITYFIFFLTTLKLPSLPSPTTFLGPKKIIISSYVQNPWWAVSTDNIYIFLKKKNFIDVIVFSQKFFIKLVFPKYQDIVYSQIRSYT